MPLFNKQEKTDVLRDGSKAVKVDKRSTSTKTEKIFASINTQVTNESEFSHRSVILLEKIYDKIDKMGSERGIPVLLHKSTLAKKDKKEIKARDKKLLKVTKENKNTKSDVLQVDKSNKDAKEAKPSNKDDSKDEKESNGFFSKIKNKISSNVSSIEDFDGDSDNSVKNTVHKIVSVIAPELTLIPSLITGIKETVSGSKDKLVDAKKVTKEHLKFIGIGRKNEEEEKKDDKKESKAKSKKTDTPKNIKKSEPILSKKPDNDKLTKVEKNSIERSEKQLIDQKSNTEFLQERMFPIAKVKETKLKEIDKNTEKLLKIAKEGGGLFGDDSGGPDIDIDRKKKRKNKRGKRIKGGKGSKMGRMGNLAKNGASMLGGLGGAMTGGLGFSGLMGSSMGGIGAAGGAAMATSGAMVLGAGAAGYGAGMLLNKGMGSISDKLTGGKYKGKGWLGDMAYDKINGDKEKDNEIIYQTVDYKDKSSVEKSISQIEDVIKRKKDEFFISSTDKQMIKAGESRIASLKGFLERSKNDAKTDKPIDDKSKVEKVQSVTEKTSQQENIIQSEVEKGDSQNTLEKVQKSLSTNIASTTIVPPKPASPQETVDIDKLKTNPISTKKENLGRSSNNKSQSPPGVFNNKPDDYKLVFVLTGGY